MGQDNTKTKYLPPVAVYNAISGSDDGGIGSGFITGKMGDVFKTSDTSLKPNTWNIPLITNLPIASGEKDDEKGGKGNNPLPNLPFGDKGKGVVNLPIGNGGKDVGKDGGKKNNPLSDLPFGDKGKGVGDLFKNNPLDNNLLGDGFNNINSGITSGFNNINSNINSGLSTLNNNFNAGLNQQAMLLNQGFNFASMQTNALISGVNANIDRGFNSVDRGFNSIDNTIARLDGQINNVGNGISTATDGLASQITTIAIIGGVAVVGLFVMQQQK